MPDHIANQIAAGEVIQRPASAAKEMIENALDSGASDVKLIIKDSGKTLIQVVDNGCGMSETDSKMSFERHATSKIRNADDLFNIKTMGFRGEAMASMAAIAHIEVSTKLTENELGTRIIVEGSKIKKQESVVCANGTSISIKNLFYNVPARRKFLKSDKVEKKHIIEEFSRVALSNPEVSFSLIMDNQEYYHLEQSNFRQRIVNIIGKKTNEKLVPVEEETNLVGRLYRLGARYARSVSYIHTRATKRALRYDSRESVLEAEASRTSGRDGFITVSSRCHQSLLPEQVREEPPPLSGRLGPVAVGPRAQFLGERVETREALFGRRRFAERFDERASYDHPVRSPTHNLLRLLLLRDPEPDAHRFVRDRLELRHELLHAALHAGAHARHPRDADEVDEPVARLRDLLHSLDGGRGSGEQH